MTQPDAAEILDRLAVAGGRRTASRRAIVEAILASEGHITADEIASQVEHRLGSVNISTVYRTLDALESIGVVDHVHLGHGRAIYHLTIEAHQHLVCDTCQEVVEIPVDKLAPFERMLEREYGFEIDRRHFAIVGTCARCR